jgi:hypothetical protein
MDESGDEDKGSTNAKIADEEELGRDVLTQEPEQTNANGEPSEEQDQTKTLDDALAAADASGSIPPAGEDRLPNGDKHGDEPPDTIAVQAEVPAEVNGSATVANDALDSGPDAITT